MKFWILAVSLLAGCASYRFDVKKSSVYLQGNQTGVVLAHGRGKHPAWKVVNPLRKALNHGPGYSTLSVQMPTYENHHWQVYGDNFDKAELHIKEAIKLLKQRGVNKVYLVGHSMGARMSAYYASRNPDIAGVVIIGCRNNGGYPLDCSSTIKHSKVPVLDIHGTGSHRDAHAAQNRSRYVGSDYRQIAINGADHKFTGYDQELIQVVVEWLQ